MDRFAKNLAAARENAGLSRTELAAKIYAAPMSVRKWENGVVYPHVTTLILISDVLGVSIDDLVKGEIWNTT